MILLDKVKQIEKTVNPHPLMRSLMQEKLSHEAVAMALGIPFHTFSYYMIGWEQVPEWLESEFRDLITQMIEQDMWEMDELHGHDFKSESIWYMGQDKY